MMGKVTRLNTGKNLDLPADEVLTTAMGKLETVIVIGIEKDSDCSCFLSSTGDPTKVLWLIEGCKKSLLGGWENDE